MDLGHAFIGSGAERVIVIHDWFCDVSSYDSMIPYLDHDLFTYCFVDLRGYGRSKGLKGEYTVEEASKDIVDLANYLEWDSFHLVGHSMSAMIVQRVALDAKNRVLSFVALTPVPACGSPAPGEVLSFLEDAAEKNDVGAKQIVHMMTSNRHTDTFVSYKVKRWRETSTEKARQGYLKMFSDTDFSKEIKGLSTQALVVVGAHDIEAHSEKVMKDTFLTWLPNAKIAVLNDAGHYPMQETPVLCAGVIEDFLREQVLLTQ